MSTKVDPMKKTLFVIEKYVEDVKQDEKSSPGLLESLMKPTCLVKDALRQILLKWVNLDPKSLKLEFQLFGFRKSDGFPPPMPAFSPSKF